MDKYYTREEYLTSSLPLYDVTNTHWNARQVQTVQLMKYIRSAMHSLLAFYVSVHDADKCSSTVPSKKSMVYALLIRIKGPTSFSLCLLLLQA